jgi:histidinol-phosphate aminotransferase
MSVTFSDKLARMPHYEVGMGIEDAKREFSLEGAVKLASNESPWPPHPDVLEAIATAAADLHRYPDSSARELRRRIAERHETEPSRVAVGNGSCEILLAAAEALCEPGAEILYAWPAFSMYPHLAAISGAREVTVPLRADHTHDLDAMLAEVTAATQLVLVCNPNNPTGTYLPATSVEVFLEALPGRVTAILDEAYIDFQTVDDPASTADLLASFPNLVVLRTFSKSHALAGLRVGYALCSPQFRAAVDAVRQPFSVNSLAQAAATEAILHEDEVVRRVERTVAERLWVEEELAELGVSTSETQANFSWVSLGGRDDAEVFQELARRGVIVRAGGALGGPGHLRVTYGTRQENQAFVTALGEVLGESA